MHQAWEAPVSDNLPHGCKRTNAHTDKQNMLSYRVSILSYDSGPKIRKKMPLIVPEWQKNRFPVANFLVTNKLQLYAPSSTTNLALLLCMMYEVTTQHSAPTLERRNSDHMQNMCQNVEAFKVNRLVYATFLSFFFSQHRIRTRKYELLLNLTHYTFVSKTSVLSYSKPDIHR